MFFELNIKQTNIVLKSISAFLLSVMLTLIVGSISIGNVQAASFDCTLAQSASEKLICSNPELSTLDEELAKQYNSRLTATNNPSALKIEQRRWLKQLRSQCQNALCYIKAYNERISLWKTISATESSDKPHAETSNNEAYACDEDLSKYLDQAKSIAIKLPQIDKKLKPEDDYGDEHWIHDPVSGINGGHRYLMHDIAVGYSKLKCWEQALSTAERIENPGVKDSAWAAIAIEYAKNDRFDDSLRILKAIKYPRGGEVARKYVSKELIRVGRIEEAQRVLRGAGLFGNHLESYYYKHAMTLADAGRHEEAIDYVNSLNGMEDHVRNSFGALLLRFQKKGDSSNAKKIISYYESGKYNDAPIDSIALYYLNEKNVEKAVTFISKIDHVASRARMLLDLSSNGNGESLYKEALEIIDKYYKQDPKNNWTIIAGAASNLYFLKGQKVSSDFINKYIDKNTLKAGLAHEDIVKELLLKNKPEVAIDYLKNVDGTVNRRLYYEAIAKSRAKTLQIIPDISIVENSTFLYRILIIEIIRNGYPVNDVLIAIEKNYQSEYVSAEKSELLSFTAMFASDKLGDKNAVNIYKNKNDDLLRAYWLIGISKRNDSQLEYKPYI